MENEKFSELKQKRIRYEYFCNTETLWEAILTKESRFFNFLLLYPVFHLSYKLRNKIEDINILRNLWKNFLVLQLQVLQVSIFIKKNWTIMKSI